jgi:hypothetical protein
MHASMGKNHLSHLGLLHIHYDMQVDMDEVVDRYARIHPRTGLTNLALVYTPVAISYVIVYILL